MKRFFALYDTSVCETIRLYSTMEKAMVAAINRIAIFSNTCTGIDIDHDNESVVIDFRNNEDGRLYAMVINLVYYNDLD